jgi:hypothetical protein
MPITVTPVMLAGVAIAGIVFLIVTIVYAIKWQDEKANPKPTCPNVAGTLLCPTEGTQQTVQIDGLVFGENEVTVNFNKISANVSDIVVNVTPGLDTANLVPTITNITETSAVVKLTRTGGLPNVYNIEARRAKNSGIMTNFLQVVPLNKSAGYGFVVPDIAAAGFRWFYADKILQQVVNSDGFLILGTITMVPRVLLVDDIPHILFADTTTTTVFLAEAKDNLGTDFKAAVAVPKVALYAAGASVLGTVQSVDKKVSGLLYQAAATGGTFDLNVAVSVDGFLTTSLNVKVASVVATTFYEPMFEIQEMTGNVFVGIARKTATNNICNILFSENLDTPDFTLLHSVAFETSLLASVQWKFGSFSDDVLALLAVASTGENKLFTSSDNFVVGQQDLVVFDAVEAAQPIIASFVTDNGVNKIYACGAAAATVETYFVQFQSGTPWTGKNLIPRKQASVSTAAWQLEKGLALQAMYASSSGITSVGLIGGVDKHTVNFSLVSSN